MSNITVIILNKFRKRVRGCCVHVTSSMFICTLRTNTHAFKIVSFHYLAMNIFILDVLCTHFKILIYLGMINL